MKRIFLLSIPLLLITSLFTAPARTQPPAQNTLPDPANFPQAGANCKRRVNLSPWVGTPGVEWPKTFQCVLSINTCDGVKTYTSNVRPGGPGMCADYWKAHDALVNREICCDPGSPQETPSPEAQPSLTPKCGPATPWFDTSSDCKEKKNSQLVISGGTAILYMCGHPVFYNASVGHDDLFNTAYRAAIEKYLLDRGLDKVCCDKFNDAVSSGNPCDPRSDVDCDGQPNKSDSQGNGVLPAIDGIFTERPNAERAAFPTGLTLDEIMPPDQCKDCKWELIKGVVKCNPDPTKRHTYESTWRCPTTGAVVQVDKLSKPGANCPY